MQPLSVSAAKPGSTPLLSITNSYCASGPDCATNNGNVLSQSIAVNAATPQYAQTFSYDTLNRLTAASEGSTWSQGYGYDLYGNRWVSSTSGVSASAFTPISSSNFNAANRLHVNNATYDNAGNQSAVGGFAFTYDAENRQTLASQSGIATVAYVYDGEGRRVQMVSCPAGTNPCTAATTGASAT
jgi:YD repeat-containing protein